MFFDKSKSVFYIVTVPFFCLLACLASLWALRAKCLICMHCFMNVRFC